MPDPVAPAPATPPAPVTSPVDLAAAPVVDKPVEPVKAAEPVLPEKYEFKGADGNPLLADEVVAEWSPLLKELKLDNAGAQKLVEMQLKQQEVMGKQLTDALEADRGVWREAAKADKDFGGVNFDANVKLTSDALTKYGDAEFSSLLKDSGLGDHPAVLRFLAKVGKALPKDDALPGQVGNIAAANSHKSYGERLYPNTPSSI
jgi:uncharacterized phage-associated protein